MTNPKITYAPNTVFIVQYETFAQRVANYMKFRITMVGQRNLIVVKHGDKGHAQDEFRMSNICECHKEQILAILN